MASEAQRRARREARRQQAGSLPRRAARAGADGAAARVEPHREHVQHGRRFRFIRESWGELQKVEWPNQNQVVQGTVVVLVACVIVGVYLWAADEAFRRLVQHIFLGE